MPVRVHVSAAVPQIDMPTESIDRLAAHAAESRTLDVSAFAIGRGWRSICGWQSMLAGVVELPSPAAGRSAPSCKRTRQPIGADRVGAPIRIYRKSWGRRHERAAECPTQNCRWKDAWQCPSETRKRPTISLCLLRLPFGHLRLPRGEKQLVPRTPSKKATTRPGIDQEALVSFGLSPPSIPIFPNVLELLSQKGANLLQCTDLRL
jgi:hypothetical protein